MGKIATQCDAKTRAGGKCAKPAGWGTPHPGNGRCKLHGGCVPNHLMKAALPTLEDLAGYHIDVDPMEALLMCVRICAAEVAYFSHKITLLTDDEVVERPWEETVAGAEAEVFDLRKQRQLNVWIRVRQQAVERLARASKMALDAGVEERLVKVAEQVGGTLADAIKEILDGLRLTAEQTERAPDLVRRALVRLEGGPTAVNA